eukprot:CAMPEP_0178910036 /NCGR_PEP_ID=MMETSP0786-20121207/8873_1 /TAXON_ID=186022 /ORGANISM="Thalassionema frauenfeldii, Strain CCMP 1798" /LENGTH=442 /DNA_ID=CAMNT_0020582241 /DNA_START=98 /DNA_END=1426 /DNA_ORIENTATION=+
MALDKYLLLLAAFATLVVMKVMVFTSAPSSAPTAAAAAAAAASLSPIVVIDAGSSGSRAHIFHPDKSSKTGTGGGSIEPKHESLKTKPGLSSYADKPGEAGKALQPLMDFIREQIPDEEVRKTTKLVLKATAGMRLLPIQIQNDILASVTAFLKQQELQFVTAEVIDGEEEGLLGWMSVNFLRSKSSSSEDSKELYSVIEMGGASVQVTVPLPASSLRSNSLPKSIQRPYKLSQHNKGTVYTHSFLGLGMESARKKVNQILEETSADHDPCLNTGYDGEGFEEAAQGVPSAKPSGNGPQCRELIRKVLFTPKEDEKKPCDYSQGCLFNGLPSFPKPVTKLWGFENIFYTPSAMGLPREMPLTQLLEMGNKICEMDWATLESQYPKDDQPTDINEKWCFGSLYLYTFFVDGLGLEPSTVMTVSNDVDGNGIDWSLGAALMQSQ